MFLGHLAVTVVNLVFLGHLAVTVVSCSVLKTSVRYCYQFWCFFTTFLERRASCCYFCRSLVLDRLSSICQPCVCPRTRTDQGKCTRLYDETPGSVHFPRSVLFCHPHQQLFPHSFVHVSERRPRTSGHPAPCRLLPPPQRREACPERPRF